MASILRIEAWAVAVEAMTVISEEGGGDGKIDNGVEQLAIWSVTYGPAPAKPARPMSDESMSANLVLARTPVDVEPNESAS